MLLWWAISHSILIYFGQTNTLRLWRRRHSTYCHPKFEFKWVRPKSKFQHFFPGFGSIGLLRSTHVGFIVSFIKFFVAKYWTVLMGNSFFWSDSFIKFFQVIQNLNFSLKVLDILDRVMNGFFPLMDRNLFEYLVKFWGLYFVSSRNKISRSDTKGRIHEEQDLFFYLQLR